MVNVRIDANGMPKGPVFEATPPAAHRSNVTAVDAADPAEAAGLDTAGYQECRFDLDLAATGLQHLKVAVLFWNARAGAWFRGGERTLTAAGRWALAVPCRGQRVFLKVVEFAGTSFTLHVDASLS